MYSPFLPSLYKQCSQRSVQISMEKNNHLSLKKKYDHAMKMSMKEEDRGRWDELPAQPLGRRHRWFRVITEPWTPSTHNLNAAPTGGDHSIHSLLDQHSQPMTLTESLYSPSWRGAEPWLQALPEHRAAPGPRCCRQPTGGAHPSGAWARWWGLHGKPRPEWLERSKEGMRLLSRACCRPVQRGHRSRVTHIRRPSGLASLFWGAGQRAGEGALERVMV